MSLISLYAENYDNQRQEFTAEVKIFTIAEKWQASLKIFFIFFGLAIASVFVPILHFVLVPGFFLFGIYKGLSTFQQIGVFPLIEFCCPGCKTEIHLEKIAYRFPQRDFCTACRQSYRLDSEKPSLESPVQQ